MKNTYIKWIGFIPNEWGVRKVKHCFYISKDPANTKNPTVLSLARSGIKVRDISTNEGQLAASYENYNVVKPGDLLLNPMDLYSGANCNMSEVEGVISPAYVNLRKKIELNVKYFDYYFKTQYWSMAMFAHGKGVSFDNRWTINSDSILNYWLPFPSKNVQDSIVCSLNEKCGDIDRLVDIETKQIETLKEYKKRIIKEVVSHGLNNSSFKKCLIEWVDKIPSHWNCMPNKYVMKKTKSICEKYNGENVISLSMNGVIVRDLLAGGKMPTSFDGYQFVYPGNLLMCLFDYDVTPRCIGLIRNYGVTSPAYSQFELNKNSDPTYYYYYYLMIDHTKELLHLARNLRHSFTEDELGRIYVPVPPLSEQIYIGKYLDEKCKEIDDLIDLKLQKIEKLNDYKKSVIFEYITGKKEVVS